MKETNGFCGSEFKMPDDLARKIIRITISNYYYGNVTEAPNRGDGWKSAFDFEEICNAMRGIFCSVLPWETEEELIKAVKEEISNHTLRNVIPLNDKSLSRVKWEEGIKEFYDLHAQVEEFATRWKA